MIYISIFKEKEKEHKRREGQKRVGALIVLADQPITSLSKFPPFSSTSISIYTYTHLVLLTVDIFSTLLFFNMKAMMIHDESPGVGKKKKKHGSYKKSKHISPKASDVAFTMHLDEQEDAIIQNQQILQCDYDGRMLPSSWPEPRYFATYWSIQAVTGG